LNSLKGLPFEVAQKMGSRPNGFNVPAIRQILKLRKKDAQEREEEETILETYMHCLGMLPLFEDQDN
jgi:uncharacterized protein (UPF0335 family)